MPFLFAARWGAWVIALVRIAFGDLPEDEGCDKLAKRYSRLLDYIEPRLSLWGIAAAATAAPASPVPPRSASRRCSPPTRHPKANAIDERLVGALRRECLNHLIIINKRHLRLVLKEYAAHYNQGRPHRSLGLAPPNGPPVRLVAPDRGRVKAHPVVGGLHHEYEWGAP